ncbi:MAG TPA: GNAT family N-acetyltransferase [Ignavibacteria bacterium]|nr:GNAT family N-acetyltransferase [Ignavibacteria bacterium]
MTKTALKDVKIRRAEPHDKANIIKLIIELAEFEKLEPPNEEARKRLIKEAFSLNPSFEILVADKKGGILGYAFYFFTFSSFKALKTLYLEDIFVTEKYRSEGIGKLFLKELKDIAKKNKCGRMEWCVLNWNVNAIEFYNKLGAKPMNEWTWYRLEL